MQNIVLDQNQNQNHNHNQNQNQNQSHNQNQNMDIDLDLNLDNYDYEDILSLFKLNYYFGEKDLKVAKHKVLMMHPDKSGLDKKYFLFFSAAYKSLYSVHEFREKANKSENLKLDTEIEYLAEENIYNKEILDSLKKNDQMHPEKFNKWFNELFDKVKLNNDYEEGGYGEWLKNTTEEELKHKNLSRDQLIDLKKSRLRANVLSKKVEISEFNSLSNQNENDLTSACPDSYASGMFSKLQFEDLKIAHEESVVPVTEEDFIDSDQSLEELKLRRGRQNLVPLSEREAAQYNSEKHRNETVISSERAFKLLKQEESGRLANDKFWSSLKYLTN